MVRSWDEVLATVQYMRDQDSPLKRQMEQVRIRYNGDYVVPVPEVDGMKALPPLTPALIGDAVDNLALQCSGVMPFIHCPAVDPGKEKGIKSREYAAIRRMALQGTWYQNRMKLIMRRFYRQLAGYATTSLVVLPDFINEIPQIRMRDPLATYVEPRDAEDLSLPEWGAFVYAKSGKWIHKHYPQARPIVNGRDGSEMWDMVEWIDCDQIYIGLLGPQSTGFQTERDRLMTQSMALSWYENRMGVCPIVAPKRVTMDRVASPIANIIGITDLMARLMALDIIATEKSIFPDMYVIGKAGQTPQVVGGWKDGRDGEMNVILDADAVGQLRATPDPNNKQTMDRLERNARISTSNVPQFGGETYGALRTGRGIDALGGMAVDPKTQEMHEIAEAAFSSMNEAIFACFEAYWPNKQFSMYTGGSGEGNVAEFVPSKHFENRHNSVNYAIPGADVQFTTVTLGQMLGTKAISLQTFRNKHPWIDDPDAETRRRNEEDLEEAVMIGFLEQVRSGSIPLIDAVNVESYVKAGYDIVESIMRADEDARNRQAAAPPPDAIPADSQIAPPMQQPGLAMPGMGAEAGLPPGGQPLPPDIEPPEPSQGNFRKLLLALNAGQAR